MKLRAVLMGGAYLVAGAFVFAAGAAAGIYADQAYPDVVPYLAHHQVGRVDTTELAQAIRLIQADYVDGNVDMTKLSHGTVSGLVASLGDPRSEERRVGKEGRWRTRRRGCDRHEGE